MERKHYRSQRIFPSVVSLFLLLIAETAISAVGRTPGEPSVGQNGDARYSIRLWTPPGTNALRPALGIDYSSAVGNGWLGNGWSIPTLSLISRCLTTLAQDGLALGVNFNTTDKFCLDGSRLRFLSGSSYGASGSTYQTEIESFRKITILGADSFGPTSFEVKQRNGLIYEYGNTTDSKIRLITGSGSLSSVRMHWALNRIRDRSNNYIDFTYTQDVNNGGYYPQEIRWTGNTNGTSPSYKAVFVNEAADRPDVVRNGFMVVPAGANGLHNYTKRLGRIDLVYIATGRLIRKYQLTYEAAGGTAALSRLQAVQECGLDGADCYSPTNFGWTTPGWTSAQTSTGQTIPSGVMPFVMDISGDGREDLVWSSSATSGSGTWYYKLADSSGGFGGAQNSGISNTNYTQAQVVQWDGDGKMDLIVPLSGGTWWALRGNGTGFDAALNTSVTANTLTVFADVDGDGRDDLIRVSSGFKYRLRSGSGFGAEIQGPAPPAGSVTNVYPVNLRQRQDFDGDGREDFMAVIDWITFGGGGNPIHSFRMTPIFGDATTGVRIGTDYGVVTYLGAGDFNGDQRTDFAWINAGTLRTTITPLSGPTASAGGVLFADWDGDGKDDALLGGSTWNFARSTGSGFAASVSTGLTAVPSTIGDVDGDTCDDIVGIESSLIKYARHNTVVPWQSRDRLQTITDGFGVAVIFAYGSLNDPAVHTPSMSGVPPTWDISDSRPVVKTVTASTGTGSTYTLTYTYFGAQMHNQGRGDLGFLKRMFTDSRSGVYTEETYLQDSTEYAWIGALSNVIVKQSAGGNKIREVTNTWAKHVYNGGTFNERRFPYVSQTVAKDYEIVAPYNGTHFRTVSTISTVDIWGTPTDVKSDTTEVATGLNPGATHTNRVLHLAVTNDSGPNWCLGKPTQTQRINSHSLTGGSQLTRSVDHAWDFVNCRVTQEVIEPGSTQWKVTADYGYDTFGNVSSKTVTPVGEAARLTGAYWGTTGQFPLTITNPLSQVTTLVWITDQGLLDTITDPNGLITNYDYDAFNRPTRVLRPDGTATRWSIGDCPSPSYCGDSLLRYYVQEDQRNTSDGIIHDRYLYRDMFDREKYDEPRTLNGSLSVVHTVYDALGRVSARSVPYLSGSGDPYSVESFSYDLLNRLTQVQRQTSEVDSSLQSTQWAYGGLSVTQTDALAHTTTQRFDAVGHVLQVIDAAGSDTDYEYDAFGNLLKTRDVLGNEVTLGYNIRGFKMGSADADLGSWTYDYFPVGELKSQTTAKIQTATFTYDKLSRPLTRIEPEGTTTWTWGSSAAAKNIGHLQSIASPGAFSESYGYDLYGRLSQTNVVADGTTYTIDLSYNTTTGFLEVIAYPTSPGSRFKVRNNYQNGLLQSVQLYVDDTPGTVYWQTNSTNARGQIIDELRGNGLQTISGYDRIAGWLDDRISGLSGSSARQNQTYSWNKVGSLTQRQELNLGVTETFVYDALDRLDFSQLNGVTNLDLAYDAIGNITSKSGVGTYVYHATKKHAVASAGANSYGYDANGNMTSRNGATITWASYNLPTSINQSGGNSSQFSYGADRSRFKHVSVDGSATETRIYVKNLFEKVTRGTTIEYKHYVLGREGVVALYTRRSTGVNDLLYVSNDHLGSTDILTTGGTNVYVRLSYDAFGKRRNGGSWTGVPSASDNTKIGDSTRRGFTFHEHPDNVALIHMNGRVYDPLIGRFIQADPYVQAPFNGQSLNRYSYVFNNPLSWTDPSGFCGATTIALFEVSSTNQSDNGPVGGGWYAGRPYGTNQPSFNVPCPDMWWTQTGPGTMSRGSDGRNIGANPSLASLFASQPAKVTEQQPIVVASLSRPNTTYEAGVRQAILRGDVEELRGLLGNGVLSDTDYLIAQRALAAMESVGSQDAAMLASRYGVDFTSTINHAFGVAKHKLAKVMAEFGSAAKAFVEAQRIVDAAYAANGSIPQVIRLGTVDVQVRGAVIDGVAYIRTLFVP